jgi:hypothetical protein
VEEQNDDRKLLPLDAERIVSFRDKGHRYTFYFSRLTQQDWENYFQGIVSSSHYENRQQVNLTDTTSAGIDLVHRRVINATGYANDFTARDGWQTKIPPKHANAASVLLRLVGLSNSNHEDAIDPERIEVRLDAAWGIKAEGEMESFEGLSHFFRPVSAEQQKRYYRATSESRLVGGSRNGKTIYAAKSPLLLKLYDELIVETAGYSFAGSRLTTGDAIQQMDGLHKVIAVSALFVGDGGLDDTE